jgi:hypothetical protein
MTVLELLLSIAFHLDPEGLNTPGSLPTGFRILPSIGSSLLLATRVTARNAIPATGSLGAMR